MASLRNRIEGTTVCCCLDEREREVVIMCPEYKQSEFAKWLKEQNVIKRMPDEKGKINDDFRNDREKKLGKSTQCCRRQGRSGKHHTSVVS